jgi:L-asparaginase / beta-aspartyl-peptidase
MKKILTSVLFIVFGVNSLTAQDMQTNADYALVIHGGAGTILKKNMSPEKEQAYRSKLQEALKAGYNALAKGATSIDAVEIAIRILEDSPLFNAGKGSVFTNDGKNEMDAAIMDGKTLKAGSIAGVRHIKNPVTGARAVMEKSEHVMMIGDGAEKFAKTCGVELVDTAYFFDQSRWDQLQKVKHTEQQQLDHTADSTKTGSTKNTNDHKFGTVGAVALDKYGNLTAATSTGGMTNKKYGRVGDAPIIGAGTYANNASCAVSATGHGEYFIRSVVAYDIAALMTYKNLSLTQAAHEVVMKKLVQLGGEGGIIAMDAKGNIAMPFNSEGMYRGYVKKDGSIHVFIYKEEK